MMNSYIKPDMPDVASSQPAQENGTLNWVGMSRIALPLQIADQKRGAYKTNSFIETYVNLKNPEVKGIHMSRLYLLLSELSQESVLSQSVLQDFLLDKLTSHQDISDQACLNIEFDYIINQPALKSEYSGWKDYPVTIKANLEEGKLKTELGIRVPYSSTCPCSAALSRQLLQKAFQESFEGQETVSKETVEQWLRAEGSVATPHSQRSYANVWVKLDGNYDQFPISQLIEVIENALQTPVQTAVKREDEQEFARLNGSNQMFCEDAARRLKNALNPVADFSDFWVRVEHIESLHAHDAVAVVTKGEPGGYSPLLHR